MPPRARQDNSDENVPSTAELAEGAQPASDEGDTGEYEGNEAVVGYAKAARPDPEDAPQLAKGEKDVYVVATDALTLKVGPKTQDALRLRRGQLVRIAKDHKYIDLERLLRLKAIAPNDGKPLQRTTPTALAAAAGAPDDPVKAPVSTVVQDATVVPSTDATVQS